MDDDIEGRASALFEGRASALSWWRKTLGGFASYLARAIPLAAFLTIVGQLAPRLPWPAFVLIFLIYAAVATMGAMYYVVVRRTHRQDMFYAGGGFSHLNRRWSILLAVVFVCALSSAVFFVLAAPRWDGLIWVLVWFVAIFYYPTFLLFDWRAKRQLRAPYHKATAMRWSSIVVLVVFCVVYAALSVHGSGDARFDALDALRNPYMPFDGAPCVLLSEMDKLSALVNNLTNYSLDQIAKTSLYAAFVVKFALAFSIFLGMTSQFAFCLLGPREIRGEFELLPVRGDVDVAAECLEGTDEGYLLGVRQGDSGDNKTRHSEGGRRYCKCYFVLLAILSVVASLAFWYYEVKTSELKNTSQYTAADAFVKKHTDELIYLLEGELDELIEDRAVCDEYRQKLDELIESRAETLDPLIDAYYDRCLLNVGAYIDWSEGVFGEVARRLGDFGTSRAADKFESTVFEHIDASELEVAYADHVSALSQMTDSYWIERHDGGSDSAMGFSFVEDAIQEKGRLDLWKPLSEGTMEESVRVALLGSSGDASREEREAEVSSLIERARSDTFASLEEIEGIYVGMTAM